MFLLSQSYLWRPNSCLSSSDSEIVLIFIPSSHSQNNSKGLHSLSFRT